MGHSPNVLWLTIIIPSGTGKLCTKLASSGVLVITSVTEKKEEATQLQESRRQPIWHVIVLYILTLSVYWPFWFAKNWSLLIHAQKLTAGEESADERLVPYTGGDELDGVKGKDPILLTIGMFVPIWDLFLAFQLFRQIAKLDTDSSTFRAKHPALTAGILLVVMAALFSLAKVLPSTLYLIGLSSLIPLAIAQHWLNQYWKQHEPADSLVRQAFSALELCAVIFGSLLLGLIVITPFVVPK